MAITHLLLDIEGTTCPVSFVADVLFPYARAALRPYLDNHGSEPEVQALVVELQQAWLADMQPEPVALRQRHGTEEVVMYLEWLIDNDIKLTPLKDLQGRIWRAGYAAGDLLAPLFADVAPALQRWHASGLVLTVYSSGSVPAQQLLYQHTESGDLRALFSHWFDTRTGAKQQSISYTQIADLMQTTPEQVLFISDSLAELQAAAQAGMACLFSDREGNPGRDSGGFERISDYSQLHPAHGHQHP